MRQGRFLQRASQCSAIVLEAESPIELVSLSPPIAGCEIQPGRTCRECGRLSGLDQGSPNSLSAMRAGHDQVGYAA